MFSSELATLRRLGVRHVLLQALNFATVLSTALMLWKGLSLLLNTESPIVVVLSGSMEPAFYRGDLLFLSLPRSSPLKVGDITVYNVPGASIPIVHRIIETHEASPRSEPATKHAKDVKVVAGDEGGLLKKGEQWLLTKGDNNAENDVGLYNGLKYLRRSNIVGKVDGYVPYVGYVTIMMNDYPQIKYVLLTVLAGAVLFHRE